MRLDWNQDTTILAEEQCHVAYCYVLGRMFSPEVFAAFYCVGSKELTLTTKGSVSCKDEASSSPMFSQERSSVSVVENSEISIVHDLYFSFDISGTIMCMTVGNSCWYWSLVILLGWYSDCERLEKDWKTSNLKRHCNELKRYWTQLLNFLRNSEEDTQAFSYSSSQETPLMVLPIKRFH